MGGSTGGKGDDALTVTADLRQSPPVLVVGGELDMDTADVLEHAAAALPDTESTVVVDVSTLSFVDSSGLTAMVRIHRSMMRRGGSVIIRGARPFVREILQVAGLDRVFRLEP